MRSITEHARFAQKIIVFPIVTSEIILRHGKFINGFVTFQNIPAFVSIIFAYFLCKYELESFQRGAFVIGYLCCGNKQMCRNHARNKQTQ